MSKKVKRTRTSAQNKLMHGYTAKCGLSKDDLRDYAAEVSNGRTDHTSELYVEEAAQIIDRLQKIAEPKKDVSIRTVQYRRQTAGVEQIVTVAHLTKLKNLWFKKSERTAEGLEKLCNRIIKHSKPRTTKECNKVIEAIKQMNSPERAAKAKARKEAA
ncbi:MAG TPA: hypothetical protein PKY59_17010 [Pyrinomonadaceae bacterium]|nr:hypothetical protein [Pyrinomonadaceae bacterium]